MPKLNSFAIMLVQILFHYIKYYFLKKKDILTSFFSDSVAAYEQIGIDANEEEEKEADGQINSFLDKLDHNGQMEVAHG